MRLLLISFLLVGTLCVNVQADTPVKSASNFYPKNLDKLAVIIQKEDSLALDEYIPLQRIEDRLISILLDKGYQVVSRSDLQFVMQELNFQNSVLTDENAVQVGERLRVPAILIFTITEAYIGISKKITKVPMGYSFSQGRELREIIAMGARLLHAETGSILWAAVVDDLYYSKAMNVPTLELALTLSAESIAETFPTRY